MEPQLLLPATLLDVNRVIDDCQRIGVPFPAEVDAAAVIEMLRSSPTTSRSQAGYLNPEDAVANEAVDEAHLSVQRLAEAAAECDAVDAGLRYLEHDGPGTQIQLLTVVHEDEVPSGAHGRNSSIHIVRSTSARARIDDVVGRLQQQVQLARPAGGVTQQSSKSHIDHNSAMKTEETWLISVPTTRTTTAQGGHAGIDQRKAQALAVEVTGEASVSVSATCSAGVTAAEVRAEDSSHPKPAVQVSPSPPMRSPTATPALTKPMPSAANGPTATVASQLVPALVEIVTAQRDRAAFPPIGARGNARGGVVGVGSSAHVTIDSRLGTTSTSSPAQAAASAPSTAVLNINKARPASSSGTMRGLPPGTDVMAMMRTRGRQPIPPSVRVVAVTPEAANVERDADGCETIARFDPSAPEQAATRDALAHAVNHTTEAEVPQLDIRPARDPDYWYQHATNAQPARDDVGEGHPASSSLRMPSILAACKAAAAHEDEAEGSAGRGPMTYHQAHWSGPRSRADTTSETMPMMMTISGIGGGPSSSTTGSKPKTRAIVQSPDDQQSIGSKSASTTPVALSVVVSTPTTMRSISGSSKGTSVSASPDGGINVSAPSSTGTSISMTYGSASVPGSALSDHDIASALITRLTVTPPSSPPATIELDAAPTRIGGRRNSISTAVETAALSSESTSARVRIMEQVPGIAAIDVAAAAIAMTPHIVDRKRGDSDDADKQAQPTSTSAAPTAQKQATVAARLSIDPLLTATSLMEGLQQPAQPVPIAPASAPSSPPPPPVKPAEQAQSPTIPHLDLSSLKSMNREQIGKLAVSVAALLAQTKAISVQPPQPPPTVAAAPRGELKPIVVVGSTLEQNASVTQALGSRTSKLLGKITSATLAANALAPLGPADADADNRIDGTSGASNVVTAHRTKAPGAKTSAPAPTSAPPPVPAPPRRSGVGKAANTAAVSTTSKFASCAPASATVAVVAAKAGVVPGKPGALPPGSKGSKPHPHGVRPTKASQYGQVLMDAGTGLPLTTRTSGTLIQGEGAGKEGKVELGGDSMAGNHAVGVISMEDEHGSQHSSETLLQCRVHRQPVTTSNPGTLHQPSQASTARKLAKPMPKIAPSLSSAPAPRALRAGISARSATSATASKHMTTPPSEQSIRSMIDAGIAPNTIDLLYPSPKPQTGLEALASRITPTHAKKLVHEISGKFSAGSAETMVARNQRQQQQQHLDVDSVVQTPLHPIGDRSWSGVTHPILAYNVSSSSSGTSRRPATPPPPAPPPTP